MEASKSKVALVYPEVFDLARFKDKRKEFPPFGVLYLASVLENVGYEVAIFKISPGETLKDFRGYISVGFSIPSSATYGLIKECRFSSTYDTDCLIMVGGVHPNFYPERTLLDLKPHVVGIGEGEELIIELMKEVNTKDFSKIPGACYLKDGVIVKNESKKLSKDIDWLPLPARHLLNTEDFVMEDRLSNTNLRMAHVMFTRGCPFPCHFCAAAQSMSQFRSGYSARTELLHLIEKYDIDGFAIVDDNFIVNKRKVADICENIADLNVKWSALSRVDTVDEALLKKMAESGCIEIKYGVETGSEPLLKAMAKNTTRDQIRHALKTTYNLGIKVKIFLIHGYPGENLETTYETLEFLKELSPMIERVSLFRFVPLPGTYVYENAAMFNLRNTDQDPNWDGDWGRYHIHHNDRHWWGTEEDFALVKNGYKILSDYVSAYWN